MHITLTANTDWYLYNFRLDLARALFDEGHRVSMVCPPGPYVEKLRDEGFRVRTFTAPAAGFSLTGNRLALKEITAAYRALRPELVHLFTPVCVLLGSIAAWRCRVPYRVAALTGMGHVFTAQSVKARAVRPALKWLFRRELGRPGTVVVVQNTADRDELVAAGIASEDRCYLVRGSGVDVERFRPRAAGAEPGRGVRILFASRLLKEKGLEELLAAFALVRAQRPGSELLVAGEVYPANPSSFSADEVAGWARRPGVSVLGHVADMPSLLGDVEIVALPSYREGTPKVLLEAAASGLPIVATDIPGCRGVVEEGESGYLVPVGDVRQLAERLGALAGDRELRARFGVRGRRIVEGEFASGAVIAKTLAVYNDVTGSRSAAVDR